MTEPSSFPDESSLLRALRASPSLFDEIARAKPAEKETHLQQRLRDEFPVEMVVAALTLHDIRR